MDAETLRHGAYLCVSPAGAASTRLAAARVAALTTRLSLESEFLARDGHPSHAIAYLRRVGSTPGHLADGGLSSAEAILHVASSESARVEAFCSEFTRLVAADAHVRVLQGVVQPTRYTGGEMHAFAYARQRRQESATSMPNAFLLPLRKTAEWWEKTWMERHTYFLPRFDADGRMVSEGHALAASAGVAALMRRTYRCAEPAPDGAYEFLTYFECADTDVPAFHAVCAALREVRRNPEWAFVREGPLWQGRRRPDWSALWTR
jgi:hypothetical protein